MIRHFNFGVVVISFIVLANWTLSESFSSQDEHHIVFNIKHDEVIGLPRTNMKALRDGEEDVTTEAPEKEANTTSLDQCEGGKCCYQFTWPGSADDTDQSNFTCKNKQKAPQPCKSPVVLTNNPNGNRPNLTDLEIYCEKHVCKIYCVRSNMACIKYSFYKKASGGLSLWNETKFCGVVTSTNNQKTITNGCFKEDIDGYTKEVCVCDKDRCNSSNMVNVSTSILLFSILVFFFSQK